MKKYIISLILLIFSICAYSQVINLSDTIFGLRILKTNPVQNIPVALNVSISGNTNVDSTLTLNYTFYDREGDLEGATPYKWIRNGAETDSTRQQYVLSQADSGYYIKASVTPVALTGFSPGVAVVSDSVGPIIVPADTAKYYVSNSGDDSNDGLSSNTSWRSITKINTEYALGTFVAGDTILFKRGDTWELDSDTTLAIVDYGGTPGNPIVFDGGKWGTGDYAKIITTEDRTTPYYTNVHISNCSNVVFQRFYVDGQGYEGGGITVGGEPYFWSPGDHAGATDSVTVTNNIVRRIGDLDGSYNNGIRVRCWKENLHNIIVSYNSIDSVSSHGITFYPMAEEYLGGDTGACIINSKIIGNTITDYRLFSGNTGFGIHLNNKNLGTIIEYNTITDPVGRNTVLMLDAQGDYAPRFCIVRYNVINGKTAGGIASYGGKNVSARIYGNVVKMLGGANNIAIDIHGDVVYTSGSSHAIFYNTLIVDGSGKCFDDRQDIAAADTFANNICYSSGTNYLSVIQTVGNVIHSNNSWYGPNITQPGWVIEQGSDKTPAVIQSTWETTGTITDPTFTVNFSNLHLQTGSPAIGAGVAISGITEDIEGNPMQEYIGAYQSIEDP